MTPSTPPSVRDRTRRSWCLTYRTTDRPLAEVAWAKGYDGYDQGRPGAAGSESSLHRTVILSLVNNPIHLVQTTHLPAKTRQRVGCRRFDERTVSIHAPSSPHGPASSSPSRQLGTSLPDLSGQASRTSHPPPLPEQPVVVAGLGRPCPPRRGRYVPSGPRVEDQDPDVAARYSGIAARSSLGAQGTIGHASERRQPQRRRRHTSSRS
jgi:hypothetical protein